jgi:hypothetical protein
MKNNDGATLEKWIADLFCYQATLLLFKEVS